MGKLSRARATPALLFTSLVLAVISGCAQNDGEPPEGSPSPSASQPTSADDASPTNAEEESAPIEDSTDGGTADDDAEAGEMSTDFPDFVPVSEFDGSNSVSTGGEGSAATLSRVEAGEHDDFYRLVFEFEDAEGVGMPSWSIALQEDGSLLILLDDTARITDLEVEGLYVGDSQVTIEGEGEVHGGTAQTTALVHLESDDDVQISISEAGDSPRLVIDFLDAE
jgi:hypothetical protein